MAEDISKDTVGVAVLVQVCSVMITLFGITKPVAMVIAKGDSTNEEKVDLV